MDFKIIKFISLVGLSMLVFSVKASFMYVPFENLLSEAELIVTGEIIDKRFVKKEVTRNVDDRSTEKGESVITSMEKNMVRRTEFLLKVDEVLKGTITTDVINIEARGGCDETGICVTGSTHYSYDVGDKVFIMLKKINDSTFYESTRMAYTAYKVTESGRIYKTLEGLETISGAGFESQQTSDPNTLIEIKEIIASQLNN